MQEKSFKREEGKHGVELCITSRKRIIFFFKADGCCRTVTGVNDGRIIEHKKFFADVFDERVIIATG